MDGYSVLIRESLGGRKPFFLPALIKNMGGENMEKAREIITHRLAVEKEWLTSDLETVRRALENYKPLVPDGISSNSLSAALHSAVEAVDLRRATIMRLSAQLEMLDFLGSDS